MVLRPARALVFSSCWRACFSGFCGTSSRARAALVRGLAGGFRIGPRLQGIRVAAVGLLAWWGSGKTKLEAGPQTPGALRSSGASLLCGRLRRTNQNQHYGDGTFSLSAPFWTTLPRSFARMIWVWGWSAWRPCRYGEPAPDPARRHRGLLDGVSLLPYSFLTYMPVVPSRHTYLAGVGLALIVAAGFIALREQTGLPPLRRGLRRSPCLSCSITSPTCGFASRGNISNGPSLRNCWCKTCAIARAASKCTAFPTHPTPPIWRSACGSATGCSPAWRPWAAGHSPGWRRRLVRNRARPCRHAWTRSVILSSPRR